MWLIIAIIIAAVLLWLVHEFRHPMREIFISEPGLAVDVDGGLVETTTIKKTFV
jgi:hypothetical protein